ncbi:hypothetical protein DM860_012668 [Cuscuta australis]|uniref:Retrotransposon gag domain-containing protein n=1 Tax=Cuscuta australis TaxID=267555 RepID=A0A328DCG2_9ASTE|nr:hypothetical protein DM860_012668 [Cuscuta australis]
MDSDADVNQIFGYPLTALDTRTDPLRPCLLNPNQENFQWAGWSPYQRISSCTDTIQPLISNVETAREAWLNLHSSFASASRSHILALKSKLGKNPRGARSINEYLHEMHSLANELALNQSPVAEEDLVSHVLNQLGLEYDPVASAAFIRGSKLLFSELGDVLRDFERKLTFTDDATSTVVATTNATQRHPSTGTHWQCFWFVGIVLSVLW